MKCHPFPFGYELRCCGPPFLQAGQLLPVFCSWANFSCKFRACPMNTDTVEGIMGPFYSHKIVCD
jgi:hypothetical protein